MVIAQDYDAYVINSARTEHKLQQFTTVNLIKNPEEVIEIISQIMEKNSKEKVLSEDLNFSEQKVYSEIVIDGFNAIGIFCLTNGSKELDKNYLGAKSLQKDNPSLKIYDVDLSLYEEKEIYKTALYESLAKENLRHYNKADNQFFEDIWQEFMLMKKEGRLSFSELKIMFNRRMDTLYKDDLSDKIAKKSDHKEIAIYFQKMLQLNNVINYLDLKHFLTNVYYNIVPYANDPLVWNTFDNIVIFIKMFNDEDDFQKMFNELSENEITWSSICNYYSKKELYSLDQREKLSFAEKDLAAINAELEKNAFISRLQSSEYLYSLYNMDKAGIERIIATLKKNILLSSMRLYEINVQIQLLDEDVSKDSEEEQNYCHFVGLGREKRRINSFIESLDNKVTEFSRELIDLRTRFKLAVGVPVEISISPR